MPPVAPVVTAVPIPPSSTPGSVTSSSRPRTAAIPASITPASAPLIRSVVSGILNTQLPAIILASIQSVNSVLCVILAVVADKPKTPALLGPVILGDVDITNPPVLLKQALEILYGAPVAETIHLEADHLGDVRRRSTSSITSSITTVISARHLESENRLSCRSESSYIC